MTACVIASMHAKKRCTCRVCIASMHAKKGEYSAGGSMVCYKRGAYWSIEQPDSSVMFSHPRLKKLIEKTKAQEVNPSMHCGHTHHL